MGQEKLPIAWDYDTHMKNVAGKLLDKYHMPFDEILNVEAIVYHGGYCETCAYETAGVEIKFKAGASTKREQFEMSFSELMRM